MKPAIQSRRADEAVMARQLSEQYGRAIGGLWEVVKFGAMMMSLEAGLTRETRSQGHGVYDNSLKQWIDERCPDINYKSAMRFKAVAEGLQREFKLGESADLHRLLTAPEDDLNKPERATRAAIADFLDGKSQRQLMFRFMSDRRPTSGGEPKPRKPKPSLRVETLVNLRRSCEAFVEMRGSLNDAEFDTGCARLLSTLNEVTGCTWSPDPHGKRKRPEYVEHARCYEVTR